MKRFLAFLCQVCPFCIPRRAWPDSAYARLMQRIERNCPACKAWDCLHRPPRQASPDEPAGRER